jgi:hypothetical protein
MVEVTTQPGVGTGHELHPFGRVASAHNRSLEPRERRCVRPREQTSGGRRIRFGGNVKPRYALLVALLSCLFVGCAAEDPTSRIGACVAAISNRAEPMGENGECDLGRRTYLVVLPRGAGGSDMAALGLPEDVAASLTHSSLTGPRWCSVTTKAGELPAPRESERRVDGYVIECVESSLEIDSPALLEAEAIRINVRQQQGGRPRVTGVQRSRR